jgi:tRNA A37 threonylcarbamoyladenosine dehydratase
MSDDYLDRFGGIGRLYGVEGLERLHLAHVCIVGIGGVGSWAAEAIARSGVGAITLIDMDDLCVTNTNRQLPAMDGNTGRLKIEVMAERIKAINPECEITCVMDFVTEKNMRTLVHAGFSYVIDCIDSAKSKAALIAHCHINKIRIVVTGAAGGQIDPTQIQIIDVNKCAHDPLISKVRSLLRRDYSFSRNAKRYYSIPCVYSTEQMTYPQPDGSVCRTKVEGDASSRLDCESGFGSVTMVTGTFGFVAASRVVKRIAEGAGKKS